MFSVSDKTGTNWRTIGSSLAGSQNPCQKMKCYIIHVIRNQLDWAHLYISRHFVTIYAWHKWIWSLSISNQITFYVYQFQLKVYWIYVKPKEVFWEGVHILKSRIFMDCKSILTRWGNNDSLSWLSRFIWNFCEYVNTIKSCKMMYVTRCEPSLHTESLRS